jgi:hypothetical protein
MTVADVARICHEVNREYRRSIEEDPGPEWVTLPDVNRDGLIAGVRAQLLDPGRTPEESHLAWLEYYGARGWKFGPVKDFELKEHPCYLPYSGLPPAQRAKDRLFQAVVRVCAPAVDAAELI